MYCLYKKRCNVKVFFKIQRCVEPSFKQVWVKLSAFIAVFLIQGVG